jgi:hypothetical protein
MLVMVMLVMPAVTVAAAAAVVRQRRGGERKSRGGENQFLQHGNLHSYQVAPFHRYRPCSETEKMQVL